MTTVTITMSIIIGSKRITAVTPNTRTLFDRPAHSKLLFLFLLFL